MDNLEIAKALFGNSGGSGTGSKSGGQTTTAYGIATSDSVNGIVRVNLGGDTVSMDDDQTIEVDTTFAVFEGDEVIVSLVGADGTGKAPCVIGVVGRGDQQQTEINSVINYVWNDEHGLHVSTAERSVQGPNILLDSDSLDIRNGVSNSEQDQTVYASFGREVTVGSRGTIPGQGQGLYSQVYGEQCIANGAYSHAEGYSNTVTGGYSHVEGASNTVGAMYSHAEGMSNVIEAKDGQGMTVSYNHVEGRGNNLQGDSSHVEGWSNTVVGQYHHIEGSHNNVEAGFGNHVEGVYNETNGSLYSVHVEGAHNISSSDYQHVQGKFNVEDANGTYQDIIGNGVNNARSNAYNMDWSGNAEFQGEVYVGGCTPNGETPYPVVRYNTSNSKQEYYNGSSWAQVPGGGGGGGGWTELWTNPNPTSDFAAQTVALDLSAWNVIAVIVKFNATLTSETIQMIRVGSQCVTNAVNIGSNAYVAKRTVTVSTSGATFAQGYRNTSGTAGAQYAIPVAIYGVC